MSVYNLRNQQYNLPGQRRMGATSRSNPDAIAFYSSVARIEGAKGGLGMVGNRAVK
jgi:hypothetical protein